MRPWLALIMFAGLIIFATTLRRESLAAQTYPPATECIIADNQVTLNRHHKSELVRSFAFREDGLRYRIKGSRNSINFLPKSQLGYIDHQEFNDTEYVVLITQSGSIILWDESNRDCYLAIIGILN